MTRGSKLYAATLVTIGAAAGVRFFVTTADATPAVPGAGTAAEPAAATGSPAPAASPSTSADSLTWGRGRHSTATPPTPSSSASSTATPVPRPAPSATRTTAPAAAPAAKPPAPAPAAPATSVVVGSTVQTRYGPVQVSVTFAGGTVSAVQALQSPSGGYSSQVSSFALPVLSREAVTAGSASIATVSGATFTSAAYRQSLQYAIDHRG